MKRKMVRLNVNRDQAIHSHGYPLRNSFSPTKMRFRWPRLPLVVSAAIAFITSLSLAAIANPIPVPPPQTDTSREIDTTIIRDYEPATIYLHDPITHRLEPHTMLVAADQPVAGAVNQIVGAYEGQDIGIKGYNVNVNPQSHEAEINFQIDNPREAKAFLSLSSANQYALIEAIRQTLAQPSYDIQDVIFQANGKSFDI